MRIIKNIKAICLYKCLVIILSLFMFSISLYSKTKSDICGYWNNYCNGGKQVESYAPIPSGPSAKELKEQWEKQDLEEASWDAYDTGLEYFERGEWGRAIIHFNEALEYNPENYDVLDDLNVAKNKLNDAYENQKNNNALQEAAAAAEYGKKSNYKDSQKVFDTAGKKASNTNNMTAVDARTYKDILGNRVKIPSQ